MTATVFQNGREYFFTISFYLFYFLKTIKGTKDEKRSTDKLTQTQRRVDEESNLVLDFDEDAILYDTDKAEFARDDLGIGNTIGKSHTDIMKQRMSRRLISIRGDGNCMFRSVSYCIYGSQERHREIRMRAVERVVANWPRYKDFIIGDQSYGMSIQSANDYRALMGRDGEYGGHVELHAISEIYTDYTFKVHRDGFSRTNDYGTGRYVKHLLFSGYFDAGHYSVLEYY